MKNTKLLNFGATVPLVVASLLGFASSARAFTLGSQLDLGGALQIDASLTTDPVPVGGFAEGGEIAGSTFQGSNNGAFDAIFAPTFIEGNDSTSLSLTNRLIDTADGGGGRPDAELGERGIFQVNAASGTFASAGLGFGDTGEVRNIDGANLPGGFTCGAGGDAFVCIGSFALSLESISVDDSNLISDGDLIFKATGKITDGMDIANIEYDFTANGLFFDGSGSDVSADDFISGIGSYSGTVITVVNVPEPTTGITGILATVSFGYLLNKKKKIAAKKQGMA